MNYLTSLDNKLKASKEKETMEKIKATHFMNKYCSVDEYDRVAQKPKYYWLALLSFGLFIWLLRCPLCNSKLHEETYDNKVSVVYYLYNCTKCEYAWTISNTYD